MLRVGNSRLAWLILLVLAVGAFGSGLGGGFVMDDRPAILDNPVVNGTLPAPAAFERTFWGRPLDRPPLSYRPLASLVFRLEYGLWGASPLGFHVTSLVVYLLLLALAWRLALVWLEWRGALVAVALFASFPVHVENVSSLVGRADTLACLLALGALLALEPALRGRRAGPGRVAGAALLYLAALLCKESVVLLPLVLAALVQGTADPRPWIRRQLPALALGLSGVGYMAARLALIPATFSGYRIPDDVVAGAPVPIRLAFGAGLLWQNLRLLAAPVDLCTGRKYAEVALPEGAGWLPVVLGLLLLALLAWRSWRDLSRPPRPPLLLCAFVSWLVFSSVLFPVPEVMADRFLLLPSLFLALAVGRALGPRLGRWRWLAPVLVAVVLLQGGLCALYARQWRSTAAVLSHAVLACPASVHNHARLADLLSDAGQAREAAWHYALAAEGRRHFPRPWRHPCPEAEQALPARQRLEQLHRLLRIQVPEPAWRAGLARALRRLGRQREADLIYPGQR
jgi:hypothetical protein